MAQRALGEAERHTLPTVAQRALGEAEWHTLPTVAQRALGETEWHTLPTVAQRALGEAEWHRGTWCLRLLFSLSLLECESLTLPAFCISFLHNHNFQYA